MNGSLSDEEGRYVLRFERHLGHPVDRVWRAVTVPSELAHWFPGDVEIDLKVGGKVTFTNSGLQVDSELLPTGGTVTELDAPRLLAFTWGKDPLRFELTPSEHECTLVFTHGFENRASAPRSAAGWNVRIDSFVAWLDGAAHATANWAEYHALRRRARVRRYVHARWRHGRAPVRALAGPPGRGGVGRPRRTGSAALLTGGSQHRRNGGRAR